LSKGQVLVERSILLVVQELDVTHEALHDESLEARRLRECIWATKTTLGATSGEAAEARAAAMVA
jgi:hypothetical protein